MHDDLGQRLRALGATVRRVIRGSGKPPYQEEYSVFAPLPSGMDYSPRPLPPMQVRYEDWAPEPFDQEQSGRELQAALDALADDVGFHRVGLVDVAADDDDDGEGA